MKRLFSSMICFVLSSGYLQADVIDLFTSSIDKGGYGLHMVGNGVCLLQKPFFLFELARFSTRQTDTESFGIPNEIELTFERNPAEDMNIAVSAVKDAESFLEEYFKKGQFKTPAAS